MVDVLGKVNIPVCFQVFLQAKICLKGEGAGNLNYIIPSANWPPESKTVLCRKLNLAWPSLSMLLGQSQYLALKSKL